MKSIGQVLGFVQGWQKAIECDEEALNDENLVYQTLVAIERYIEEE
jgi:hypothetical protein